MGFNSGFKGLRELGNIKFVKEFFIHSPLCWLSKCHIGAEEHKAIRYSYCVC